MNIYSTAAPVVSASITTKGKTEDTVNVVGKGDTIADLVLEAEYPCRPDVEIKEATVLGFFLGDLQVPRGVTRVYDGVPTYYQDPDGNGNRGLVDETMCVKAMLIEIPAEEEGGKPTTMKVVIDRIKAIGEVTPAADGSDDKVTGGGEIGDSSNVCTKSETCTATTHDPSCPKYTAADTE